MCELFFWLVRPSLVQSAFLSKYCSSEKLSSNSYFLWLGMVMILIEHSKMLKVDDLTIAALSYLVSISAIRDRSISACKTPSAAVLGFIQVKA